MKITEITRPKDLHWGTQALERRGFNNLEHEPGYTGGAYSSILWRPGSPYVVKLFLGTDIFYRRYLDLITTVRNVHFPVVRGKITRVNNPHGDMLSRDEYFAIRLEKLTPLISSAENTRYWAEAMLQYLQSGNISPAKACAAHLPKSLVKALGLIYTRCIRGQSATGVDLHNYNMMMRGDEVVIIDPIAEP